VREESSLTPKPLLGKVTVKHALKILFREPKSGRQKDRGERQPALPQTKPVRGKEEREEVCRNLLISSSKGTGRPKLKMVVQRKKEGETFSLRPNNARRLSIRNEERNSPIETPVKTGTSRKIKSEHGKK